MNGHYSRGAVCPYAVKREKEGDTSPSLRGFSTVRGSSWEPSVAHHFQNVSLYLYGARFKKITFTDKTSHGYPLDLASNLAVAGAP